MKKEICKNCKYWDDYYCRRYPPKVMISSNDNISSCLAYTTEHEFCGDYKKKLKNI